MNEYLVYLTTTSNKYTDRIICDLVANGFHVKPFRPDGKLNVNKPGSCATLVLLHVQDPRDERDFRFDDFMVTLYNKHNVKVYSHVVISYPEGKTYYVAGNVTKRDVIKATSHKPGPHKFQVIDGGKDDSPYS